MDDRFFSVNSILNGKVWTNEIDLDINKNILLIHANWTVGVENKCKLIETVKKKLNDN